METKSIVVYTDGGCSGNPGPGGWAFVIVDEQRTFSKSGNALETTNNRMELQAVIEALRYIRAFYREPVTVSLYTDSQYVKQGITLWIQNWKRNGWRTANKKPVKNQELWMTLDTLAQQLAIGWFWVKGHSGIEYNELCDSLVQTEIALISQKNSG